MKRSKRAASMVFFAPPPSPRSGTRAARDYYLSFERINRFARYVIGMAVAAEHVQVTASKALIPSARSEEERRELIASATGAGSAADQLYLQRQFLLEVLLVRHVENYLNYLSGLLFEIFTQRPETMKSSEKVELDFILEHDSMESLARGLAEKKVEALTYQSFDKLAEFFNERFRIEVCLRDGIRSVIELIETRNISVHNRCVVNRRYLAKTGCDPQRLGRLRVLGIEQLEQAVTTLHASVVAADRAARAHLHLRGSRFDVCQQARAEWEDAMKQADKVRRRPHSV